MGALHTKRFSLWCQPALVFIIEMIEIQGEKVIALKCNPNTLEECDDKMKAYIDKAKTKFGGDGDELEEEIGRLMKMTKGGGMKDELKAWFDTRIFLLQQMLLNSNAKEELQLLRLWKSLDDPRIWIRMQ